MGFVEGVIAGLVVYFLMRCVITGFFTVQQNERAVLTSFGRAQRLEGRSTLDDALSAALSQEERGRYRYPQLRVIGPGGPHFKFPWQAVHKADVAIFTVSAAYDPESPSANQNNTILEAVTKSASSRTSTPTARFKQA